MQAASWINMFRRIPTTQHDNLCVVTTAGAEIMVQRIIRLEDEFILIRGRPAGSTDQGRVMMIPYLQLNYIGFNKPLLEKEIQAIFGNLAGENEFAQVAPIVEAPEDDALLDDVDLEEVEETAPARPATNGKPKPPSKSILLARLRERLANGDKG